MKRILITSDSEKINKNDSSKWGVCEILYNDEVESDNEIKIGWYDSEGTTIFIPTIFHADDALEYQGAELAMKIYLACIRAKKLNIDIVLMGFESFDAFLLNFAYPNFFKCDGVHYCRMNLYELKNYKRDVEAINESRILANLKNIGIRLPESFKSNHSFINEWCAFVWADYMKFDDFSENILKTIGKYLYFDYLRTILSLDKAEEKAKKVSEGKLKRISDLSGKILLIDDSEYWRDFFEEFFRNSSGVTFKSIGKSFKGKKVTAIIDECVKAVSEFDPDVILLDFRLSEDVDYDVQYNKDVSGRQVLKKLKGSNEDPGEAYADRVIIFSATSKIENIIRLQGDLADDFILKEHPEKYIGKKPTSEAIGSLINKLEKSLLQAQYLKKLDSVIKDLLKEAESMRPDAKDRVRELVSTIRTLLYPNVDDMWLLKLAYLNLCGILEYYKGNENLKKGIDDLVSPIMEHGSTVLVPWQNLCELRNALAHSATEVEFDNGRNTKPVEPELLRNKTIELVKFIRDFVKILVKNNRS